MARKPLTDAQRAALDAGREKINRARAGKSAAEEGGYVESPEGCSEQYSAMFHVANNGWEHDRTANQIRLREFLKSKPGEFNSQLTVLEKEYRMSRKEKAEEEVVVRDEGVERALEKVEELLKEIGDAGAK